jgi:hypothetical protein
VGILNEANKWFDRSACRPVLEEGGIDYWYAEIGERGHFPAEKSIEARIVCNSCPVRVNCLAYAMERELSYVMDSRPKTHQEEVDGAPEGIWAGYLPDQRVKLAAKLTGLTPGQRAAVYRRIGTRPIHMSERALRNRAARRRAARRRAA